MLGFRTGKNQHFRHLYFLGRITFKATKLKNTDLSIIVSISREKNTIKSRQIKVYFKLDSFSYYFIFLVFIFKHKIQNNNV